MRNNTYAVSSDRWQSFCIFFVKSMFSGQGTAQRSGFELIFKSGEFINTSFALYQDVAWRYVI